MTDRRPRWSWLLFPQLSVIVAASVLAACRRLPPLALDGGLDKLGHFLMLGALSLFAVGFFGAPRWRRVVFVLSVVSALEEASQAWFPARTLDALDLAANLLGIASGGWIAARLTRRATGYAAGTVASRTRDKYPTSPISPDDDQHDPTRLPYRAQR
jgi:VanZ family protein